MKKIYKDRKIIITSKLPIQGQPQNILHNGENLKAFPLNAEKRQECLLPPQPS